MLAALGQLNSEILTAHYGRSMPPTSSMSNMARRAASLKRRAHINLSIAGGQHTATQEDVAMMREAAAQRHVARHTTQMNMLCVGPCTRVPRNSVKRIQKLARELQGKTRIDVIIDLTSELRKLPPSSSLSSDNPRLCVATGLACAVANFEKSSDVRHANRMVDRIQESEKRLNLAREIMQESLYTYNLVQNAGMSQVRELEIGGEGVNLVGGGNPPSFTEENVAAFYKRYGLGKVPPGDDIRSCLEETSKKFAPRVRTRLVRDLMIRWNQFKFRN
jgi:hypothetical protein